MTQKGLIHYKRKQSTIWVCPNNALALKPCLIPVQSSNEGFVGYTDIVFTAVSGYIYIYRENQLISILKKVLIFVKKKKRLKKL